METPLASFAPKILSNARRYPRSKEGVGRNSKALVMTHNFITTLVRMDNVDRWIGLYIVAMLCVLLLALIKVAFLE